MKLTSPSLRLAGAALTATLCACAPLPPKDATSTSTPLESSDFVATHSEPASWPNADWWRAFGDPQLDGLIGAALADSPDVRLAQARVAQADASAAQVAANAGIDLSANAQVSRQLFSATGIYPPPLAGNYANTGNLELDFSYDFDFWGKNRASLRAALGDAAAARAELEAARVVLSCAVAQSYFQWQVLSQRIDLEQQIEHERADLVALERLRIAAGLAPGENIHPLNADAAAPLQASVQLETQRQAALYRLKSLTGMHSVPALKPQTLEPAKGGAPADLHLDLLARRADVAAARDRVEAALQRVESARAQFYPDISITAFIGLNTVELSRLLQAKSRDQGITPALHLPIFDAGRLRANLAGTRADVADAVAQYQQAIQTAVADVNDAAIRLDGAERERDSVSRQKAARAHSVDSARLRVAAGLTDRREVLRDQLAEAGAADLELTRQGQVFAARIDLVKALGGGFVSPSETSHD